MLRAKKMISKKSVDQSIKKLTTKKSSGESKPSEKIVSLSVKLVSNKR